LRHYGQIYVTPKWLLATYINNKLDIAFTVTGSTRASSAANTSVRSGDLLARTTVAVGSAIARAAGAFIANLGLSKRVTIAVARRALAIKTTDTVRDDFVHFRGVEGYLVMKLFFCYVFMIREEAIYND